jgi:hypothetical protein
MREYVPALPPTSEGDQPRGPLDRNHLHLRCVVAVLDRDRSRERSQEVNEDEDAKYGALAAFISFGVIIVMVAVLGVILGVWS